MLSTSSNELFIDQTGHSLVAADVAVSNNSITIKRIKEWEDTEPEKLKTSVKEFIGLKKGTWQPGYCSVHPNSSFIKKTVLENVARAKDPKYLEHILIDELNVSPKLFKVKTLNAANGYVFHPEFSVSKNLVFCGALIDELKTHQTYLLKCGVYPNRMELGSLLFLAGVIEYSRNSFTGPIIAGEVNMESTFIAIACKGELSLVRTIPFGIRHMVPLIQKELGLEDERAISELLASKSIDLAQMASTFLNKIYKEIQASIDYYEVATGLSASHLIVAPLARNYAWIPESIAKELSLNLVSVDIKNWFDGINLKLPDDVCLESLDMRWFNLFTLIKTTLAPK